MRLNDIKNDTGNPIRAYGTWIAGVENQWPSEALHSAYREFIDTIAVSIAGAGESAALKAFEALSIWGEGESSVIGFEKTLNPPWAAMINGTSGHALDLDDNFDPPKAHASTVLVPAILALGEDIEASGAQCLDAYIVGLQILGRIGQGVNPIHRNRGWHATATLGSLGAAAACARLLSLDSERASMALSLATSMAAGFMSQFGTEAKPLHAGLAARNGVMAAHLAKYGIEGSHTVLEGRTGMNRLMVGPDYEELRDNLIHIEHGQNLRFETESIGEPLLILEHGFRVKRFANCGAAHRAMDALLFLREEHGFTAEDVTHIDVYAPRVHFNNLMYERPETGLQSKFSIEHALAICLAQGECRLEDFEDEAAERSEIRALYPLIKRNPVDKLEGEFPTSIEVHLKGGQSLREERAWPLGSKWKPFSDEEYWQKFDICAKPSPKAAEIKKQLECFRESSNVRELMTTLRWKQA
ncbi:MAG: MmgE/PrpD family protein [Sphingomonadales bacterium]|jgi:2-methylcitrate dehydratase PrpD